MIRNKKFLAKIFLAFLFLMFSINVYAYTIPTFDFVKEAGNPKEVALSLQIVFLLTIITLAPSILIMTTCFTRIAIVLGFLKQAIGARDLPPNQIVIGLSLFLTAFIMMPVWNEINQTALTPFNAGQISQEEAFNRGVEPLRKFMLKQTREKDIALFVSIAKMPRPKTAKDISMAVLIPAFIISELRTAFIIGFILYIPFLVIDMVISCILMAMGMMMLPPAMVSLPFKIIIFILIDGWYLIIKALVGSFNL